MNMSRPPVRQPWRGLPNMVRVAVGNLAGVPEEGPLAWKACTI